MPIVRAFLVLSFFLLGCRDDATSASDAWSSADPDQAPEVERGAQMQAAPDAGTGRPNPGATGVAAPGTSGDLSAELYDERRVPRFDLEVASAELTKLRRDPDTYVRASLRYGGEVVRDVGLRIKGEGSLRSLDKKPAFKLKFNEFVDDQTFRGLRHLTLNNMVEDPSFLAERLAYYVFRAARLPAPRCNSAEVYLNGALLGVYANIETEDKTFLRRWFDDDEGNLYEEGQIDFERGAENKFDLETNEAKNDRSDLRALIEVIASTSASAPVLDRWGTELDTAHFLRFTAAEAAVNQWDMYAYTVFYPNNFRLYRDPSTSKFVFLPWGMDLSMKPYRDSGRKHIPLFWTARQYDRPQGKVTAGKLFQLCLQNAACKAKYAAVVREIIAIYEGAGLERVAAEYHAQIAPLVRRDPRKEYTVEQFEAGYGALLSTIRTRTQAMRADLSSAGELR